MPRSPTARAALMLVLLSLAALPLPAQAQVPDPTTPPPPQPALCFPGADPLPAQASGPPNPKGCPGGIPDAPNFFEGGPIPIRLENVRGETVNTDPPWVRVTCVTGCLDQGTGETRNYYARWRGVTLSFPADFHEKGPDPLEAQRDAVADGAPRYNGTWHVTAMVAGQQLERTFNVWLFTRWYSSGLVVQPGETHEFRAAGIEPTATVSFRIERISTDGKWAPIPLPDAPGTRASNGVFTYKWRVLPDEATRIAECPRTVLECYRAVVQASNSAKKDEIIPFRVSVATLRLVPQFVPGGDPQAKQRTDIVDVHVALRYPSIRSDFGYALIPEQLISAQNATPTLRLLIERDNRTNEPTTLLDAISLKYDARFGRWSGSWTIPKDLPLYTQAVYRAHLIEARDRWGNLVPTMNVSNYTVTAASLDPVVQVHPAELARAEEGSVVIAIRYHNGTPVTPDDLRDAMRGCFVRDEDAVPCSNTTTSGVIEGTYEDGYWAFRKTFPIDHPRLGAHHFVLLGGAAVQDAYGNRINGTATSPFELRATSQWIDFSTVQRGRAMTTLERGELINLVAAVTYEDGTPYNATVRPYHQQPDSAPPEYNPRTLLVNLTKRGPEGAIHSVTQVALREVDVERGLWQGTLPLTLSDDETPLGKWTFEFDVKDNFTVPNLNETSFERTILPAPLRYEVRSLSNPAPSTGTTLTFSFTLRYANGAPVTATDVKPNGVVAQVYKYDARTRGPTGDPLSSQITPSFDGNAWSFQYRVPPHLFNGPYLFVLTGADASGNRLPVDAYSREFTPYSPKIERVVVAPKENLTLQRGETASFIAMAGDRDTGLDGTGKPAISVERWNANAKRWDVLAGAKDVRVDTEDILNHVGQYAILPTTPLGTYRFHLLGRDAEYRVIEAYSPNITINPTKVERGLAELPPPIATKGDVVWFLVEYRPGDSYSDTSIAARGQATGLTSPYTSIQGGLLNVTWKIPFDAPTGNYTVRLDGYDLPGNEIHVESPVIDVRAAQLLGRVLGNPARLVERGTEARFLFGVTYPNGDYYREGTAPTVLVRNAQRVVGTATVTPRDLTYEAAWRPPASADAIDHWFEVTGEGRSGNSFPTLRSGAFRVEPGDLTRPAPSQNLPTKERFETQTWTMPISVDDRNVTFWLDYYGPGGNFERVDQGPPLTSTPLQHVVAADRASYSVRWTTDAQTPVGTYRFHMEGEDRYGNAIRSNGNPFTLRTTSMIAEWRSVPTQAEFGEGKSLEFTFLIRYKTGQPVDPADFQPTASLLLERLPAKPEPKLTLEADGLWHLKWVAPGTLAPGTYVFDVAGYDIGSNQLSLTRSTEFTHQASVPESFAKNVPGLGAPALLVALVAVALLARRRS